MMINPSTLRQDSRRFRNIYHAIALALIAATLGACDLDTSAIPPPHTSASPAEVCPGSSAILSWDMSPTCDEVDCEDVTLDISSAPAGFTFSSTSRTGSISSGPITSRIDFIFEGTIRGGRNTFGPYGHTVQPLSDITSEVSLPDMIGQCDGWLPPSVSLAVGDIRPPDTRVTRIGNYTNCFVDADLVLPGGTTNFDLLPLMYKDVPLAYQEIVLGIEVTNLSGPCVDRLIRRPSCTEAVLGRWPDIYLTAEFVCDASSASMPIVAGTPEADDTPEEAFIVTNTPSSTPKITTTRTANCRRGPNDVFDVVAVLNEGFQAEPNGRDWQSTWWRILTPDGLNFCWVSNSVVEFEGPEEDVAVVDSPPTPAVGCLIYDESTPNDLTDTTCVPRACTDQDQPGASCTP